MAPGKIHDQSTCLWSMPFGLILGLCFGIENAVIGGLAFVIGGLWLSPDLDTQSNALKRWGVLKSLWWPYKRLICHRSILSHGPFVGTLIRLVYILSLFFGIIFLLEKLGLSSEIINTQSMKQILSNNKENVIFTVVGLEASAWLHLIKDGDPLPSEWHRFTRR